MTPTNEQVDAQPVLGVLAEFDTPEPLKAAVAGLRAAGYASYEAFSPYPVHGLQAAIYPEKHGFYFFRVSCNNDGTHRFAKTLEEQIANECR